MVALATRIIGRTSVKSICVLGEEEGVMEPISAAVIAAVQALASSDAVKAGVKDAYEGLKAVIRRKWGDAAPISKAITAIEEDPESKAQAAVLEEKVGAVKAADDTEVAQALRQLVEQMKTHGIGGEAVARIQFNMSGGVVQGVAGAENVQIGSMTFGAPPKT
jgi:prophage DNA circulation protein